jgi:hypothetical protein
LVVTNFLGDFDGVSHGCCHLLYKDTNKLKSHKQKRKKSPLFFRGDSHS